MLHLCMHLNVYKHLTRLHSTASCKQCMIDAHLLPHIDTSGHIHSLAFFCLSLFFHSVQTRFLLWVNARGFAQTPALG